MIQSPEHLQEEKSVESSRLGSLRQLDLPVIESPVATTDSLPAVRTRLQEEESVASSRLGSLRQPDPPVIESPVATTDSLPAVRTHLQEEEPIGQFQARVLADALSHQVGQLVGVLQNAIHSLNK